MQLNLFSYQNNIDSSDSYVPERVLLAFTDWTKTMTKIPKIIDPMQTENHHS